LASMASVADGAIAPTSVDILDIFPPFLPVAVCGAIR
jgi:hypothetical protein